MSDYEAGQARLADWHDRTTMFVEHALETHRPLRDDWRAAIADVVAEVDRIAEAGNHPDDVDRARSAMGSLAGLWLSADECDQQLYGQGER